MLLVLGCGGPWRKLTLIKMVECHLVHLPHRQLSRHGGLHYHEFMVRVSSVGDDEVVRGTRETGRLRGLNLLVGQGDARLIRRTGGESIISC